MSESDAAPDVRLAQIRESVDQDSAEDLMSSVGRQGMAWLLDRLAVVEAERDTWKAAFVEADSLVDNTMAIERERDALRASLNLLVGGWLAEAEAGDTEEQCFKTECAEQLQAVLGGVLDPDAPRHD